MDCVRGRPTKRNGLRGDPIHTARLESCCPVPTASSARSSDTTASRTSFKIALLRVLNYAVLAVLALLAQAFGAWASAIVRVALLP